MSARYTAKVGAVLSPFRSIRRYHKNKTTTDEAFRRMTPEKLATMMRKMAAETIVVGKEFNLELDLTPASIANLEVLCEEFYKIYKPTWWQRLLRKAKSVDAPTDFIGAYLGEVIIPEVGGSWIIDGEGNWGITNENGTCYPHNKVYKRLTYGDGENVEFFFRQIVEHLGK